MGVGSGVTVGVTVAVAVGGGVTVKVDVGIAVSVGGTTVAAGAQAEKITETSNSVMRVLIFIFALFIEVAV